MRLTYPLILIAVTVLAVWYQHSQNTQLTLQLDNAQSTINGQIATIHSLNTSIERITADRDKAHRAQLRLDHQLADNQSRARQQQQQLETLIHENATLKAWADRSLPAGLDLLQHPGFDTAAAYRRYQHTMPDRQPLPPQPRATDHPP